MKNEIRQGGFIAISDFHSNRWPVDDKITHYLEEHDVFNEKEQRIMNTHRLLYAIYKTQDKFTIFDRVIPHTKDMLMSLVNLSFSNYPNQEISTREEKDKAINSRLSFDLLAFFIRYSIIVKRRCFQCQRKK